LGSCSTNKNTFSTRAYHNVTSRYNIYFNGREAFKAGKKQIETSFVEPYDDILPMYYYKDKTVLTQATGDMDRAIVKATKLIKLHSLSVKPVQKRPATTAKQIEFYNKKEYNKWIDDAYLLMGNALFYQEKYFDAQKNFEFLINEYKNKPIRFDAQIALAKTKVELKSYEDALSILDKCKEETDFPERLQTNLFALYADIYIQYKKYDDAIFYLEKARETEKSKKIRVRYTYILAQLYKETGDNIKAIALFKEVEDMKPSYEMAFNAKISQATSFDSGSGSSTEIVKLLNKLLKDEKNKEYKDQIYYALANIYYEENKENKALEFYLKSLEANQGNTHQKAMSYLAIGEIYLTKKEYIQAQPFFDSCMTILPENYRNYSELKNTTKDLNALAKEHEIVRVQDSLQKIASLPEKQRLEYIDGIISDIRNAEAAQKEKERIEQENSTQYMKDFGVNNQKMSGNWYFYNESAKNFGKAEFIKRWGERTLEDNWRRSNKTTMNWDNEEELNESDSVEVEKTVVNKKSRSHYLKGLPISDSLLTASNKSIEDALFKEGMLYRNSIQDNNKAIETLESFVKRFPDSQYAPIAYYYLYIICNEERLFTKAETYKETVINKFPKSNYAKALTNPSFFKDIKKQNKQLERTYASCYKHFINNNYNNVITICNTNIAEFPDSYLVPRFEFLRALSIGKQSGISVLKEQMNTIVKSYAEDDVAKLAQDILNNINNIEESENANKLLSSINSSSNPTKQQQEEEAVIEIYKDTENSPHAYVIAAKTEFVDINRIKFNMINYNLDYFTNFNFKISTKELNKDYSLLFVETLSDSKQAMNYYELIKYSDEIFDGVEKTFTKHFVISKENRETLLNNKDLDLYLEYFSENYTE